MHGDGEASNHSHTLNQTAAAVQRLADSMASDDRHRSRILPSRGHTARGAWSMVEKSWAYNGAATSNAIAINLIFIN